jgi:Tol biopolymer transport system component
MTSVILVAVLSAGCGGGGGGAASLTTIEVTPATVEIVCGQTRQFTARCLDQEGDVMSGISVTWSANPEQVGSVSASGLFTASACDEFDVLPANGAIRVQAQGVVGSANVTIVAEGGGGDSDQRVFQNVSERVSWGSNNRVAFASFGGNGLLYTYTINDTGGDLVLLTLSDEGGCQPSFSPDATRIAISSRRGETPAIYLIDSTRGDRYAITRVTPDGDSGADTQPSFHPNGNQIVFTTSRTAGNDDIHIIGTDGAGNTPVIATAATEQWGVVSPDGTMLAYQSGEVGQTNIWVKDISGLGGAGYDPTDPGTNLTAGSPFRNGAPAWSPDGTKIAFHSNRNGDFDIFMMNVDGTGQVAITGDPRSDGYPVFSPGGDRLAITRDREIWTVPAEPWVDWRADAEDRSEQLTRRF